MNICRFIINAPVMDRPLVPYDPIKVFKAHKSPAIEEVMPIDKPLNCNIKSNATYTLAVEADGVYQCSAMMRYARNSQAQSSCSLSFNGTFSMSLPVNGTDGKSVTVEGLQVRLEKGFYQLDINFVKPGSEIQQISFTKASS